MLAALAGCGSINTHTHAHTQAMLNRTGATVAAVYVRPSGSAAWSQPVNVRARTDSQGNALRRQDGSIAYWDRVNVQNGAEIVILRDPSSSADPAGIANQDIRIVDSDGMIYTRLNVPIAFTTTRTNLITYASSVTSQSDPIVFTAADRHPMLTIRNATGYPIVLTAPFSQQVQVGSGAAARWVFPELDLDRDVTVSYSSGRMQFSEELHVRGEDAAIELTRRPATLTIVNMTGGTVNNVFITNPGMVANLNLLTARRNDDGSFIEGGQAGTGVLAGSIMNTQTFTVWLGHLSLAPGAVDVRIDGVNGISHAIFNVQATSDTTLTFTQAHRQGN
jgi:hypothetical protein